MSTVTMVTTIGEPCPICFDEKKEEPVVMNCHCSKSYCKKCLDPWLQIRNICPNCQKETPPIPGFGDRLHDFTKIFYLLLCAYYAWGHDNMSDWYLGKFGVYHLINITLSVFVSYISPYGGILVDMWYTLSVIGNVGWSSYWEWIVDTFPNFYYGYHVFGTQSCNTSHNHRYEVVDFITQLAILLLVLFNEHHEKLFKKKFYYRYTGAHKSGVTLMRASTTS